MAMKSQKKHSLHVEIQTHRKNPIGLIRSTFRENGKTKHETFARITGKTLAELKVIQAAFRGDAVIVDNPLKTSDSREFGASKALLELASDIGLDKVIYSRREPWVRSVLAMIVGRILYQNSKLALVHSKDITSLWELVGINEEHLNVEEHCYEPMDRLLQRQQAIQSQLAKQHLKNGTVVLYDITSTYFEGEYENSELVDYGYNRDKKKGHKQVVIGLICNEQGCPVCVEVFSGNTKDDQTVEDKILEMKENYGLGEIVFVGDRGMVTRTHQNRLEAQDGIKFITSLTHNEIQELLGKRTIQLELFDEKELVEIEHPDILGKRLILCRNPETARKEKATREALMNSLGQKLDQIASGATKKKASAENIAERVGRAFEKYKMGKFCEYEIIDVEVGKQKKPGKGLTWKWNQEKVEKESLIDGCYIITSTVATDRMTKEEVVATYKGLSVVEQAFRNLKTASLQMRPIHHKTDERIKAHIFICMLSYYLQWHVMQRLRPLFESNGEFADREWTLERVFETLKCIRKMKVEMNGVELPHIDSPNDQQQKILDLLGVKIA